MPLKSGMKEAPKRFIGGKYAGQVGWMEKNCNHPRTQYYVCVFLSKENEAWKRMQQKYVTDPLCQPNNFAESVIYKHPNIENTMNTLCKMLVKYNVCKTKYCIEETCELFKKKLAETFAKHIPEGHRAKYCLTDYKEEDV